MKAKVYIELNAESFHKDAVEMLNEVADLVFEPLSDEDFTRTMAEVYAAVILRRKIDEEFLNLAPNLNIVARHGVGYEKVDVDTCTERGVYVTITPNVLSDAVAELVFALLFSLTRRICEADRYVRAEWAKKDPTEERTSFPLGVDLKGKIMGIIGVGRIGCQVARRAYAFGTNLLYYDIVRMKSLEEEFGAKFAALEDLMRNSDFVSIHVPLNEETKGMIGERELSLMKESAYLINTSRGPVLDQVALTKLLKDKRIAGAGLDVFDAEPISLDDALLKLDNVVFTPHIGSVTVETRRAVAVRAAKNVLFTLKGKVPPDLVPEQASVFSKNQ